MLTAWRAMHVPPTWRREQYAEMREEFYAGLEDRKYLPLVEAQKKGLQVRLKSAQLESLN